MSLTVGNQSIPNNAATLLNLTTRASRGYLVLRNNTTSNFYIGATNAITSSSTDTMIIPAGKDTAIQIGTADQIYVYQNSGGALTIYYSVDDSAATR